MLGNKHRTSFSSKVSSYSR